MTIIDNILSSFSPYYWMKFIKVAIYSESCNREVLNINRDMASTIYLPKDNSISLSKEDSAQGRSNDTGFQLSRRGQYPTIERFNYADDSLTSTR